jgi:lipopolysaccharide export system permease protein
MFIISIFFFVMIVVLIDLFANLWRYLNYDVPFKQILTVSLYYLPKSISYAIPVALLFASAYTLGDLCGRNELTVIFSSGISFSRFCQSLLMIGFVVSVISFFFDDRIVIPTLKIKNDMARVLLHQQVKADNSDIVIKAKNGQVVYSIDYYDYTNVIINGISIIEKADDGSLLSIVRAPSANWNGEYWNFSNAIIYQWENGILGIQSLVDADQYRENPETFRRSAVNVEELSADQASLLVNDLQAAGLPFITALSDYYHRFSFASASFVVMILSISMGGRFRKNILLMSLLSSLIVAVVFYVMEMISMMMAKLGYIPPIIGAWFPVISFVFIGIILLQNAKT